MAMFMPVIGNVAYEVTFAATESSGRMVLRGRASLQAEKRHGVSPTLIMRREDNRVLPRFVRVVS